MSLTPVGCPSRITLFRSVEVPIIPVSDRQGDFRTSEGSEARIGEGEVPHVTHPGWLSIGNHLVRVAKDISNGRLGCGNAPSNRQHGHRAKHLKTTHITTTALALL